MRTPGDEATRRVIGPGEIDRLARIVTHLVEPELDVLAVYLYGSAARGEPAADVDLAVLGRRRIDPGRLERLASELGRHGVPFPLEVDIRPLWRASPRFAANVLRDRIVLFERDAAARQKLEARIMLEWLDFAPTWTRMRDRMFARWASG